VASAFAKQHHPVALAALVSLTLARTASAQGESPVATPTSTTATEPPPAPPPGGPTPAPNPPLHPYGASPVYPCDPACREGFVCKQERCVSLCNPPCPSDQVCVDGSRCEYGPLVKGGVHEPPPPKRIPFEERNHSMAAFHYGFPSDLELNDETVPTESVLGANLRSDVPVAGYLLVGPMLEFGSYEPGYYFDLDFYARARVPIDAKSVQFQIWAGVPIGLTFSFLSTDFAGNLEGFALGWNIGVLLGGAVHFSRQFGIFTEGGWQQHRMTHDRDGGGSLSISLKPWIWNVGFVFRD
jgi:hypothetical protein